MSDQVSGITGKHRNPTELQTALRVINDQLADANDLERPALELVAQKLTEQLLEVELEEESKQERHCGEEAKRPPCRESEHLEESQYSPASSATPAGDVPTAQEPTPATHKQRTEGGPDRDSERDDEWKAFLKNIPRVLIEDGTQKYVLIRISPEQNPNKRLEKTIYLVRGNPAVEYHYQCALETMKELESMGAEGGMLRCERECHSSQENVCSRSCVLVGILKSIVSLGMTSKNELNHTLHGACRYLACVGRVFFVCRTEILGGGRIDCRMKEKEVEIYGHSYQFGRADHAVTAQLIKDAFGSDFQVSWGDYGY